MAAKICIGDLNSVLTAQKPMSLKNDSGGRTAVEWVDSFEFFAQVADGSMKEVVVAGGLQASVRYRITARWDERMNASLRLVYKTMRLNVRGVVNVGLRNEWMIIEAEAGVGT